MLFLEILWLLLPAGAANMSAVLAARLFPAWDAPIDGGKKFRGKRILGNNKTWRGLIVGTLIGGTVYVLQFFLAEFFLSADGFQFQIYLGFILGFGALLGDAVKSFFKRQMNIAPGKSWMPFDQIDWILGALLLITPFTPVTFQQAIFAAAVGFFAHLLVKFIGYLLKIDSTPL